MVIRLKIVSKLNVKRYFLLAIDLVINENPPLRLILGKMGIPFVNHVYGEKLATWAAWKEVSDR